MQYSQEHLKTMVYAEFGGQTECIMGNSKIENSVMTRIFGNVQATSEYFRRFTEDFPTSPKMFEVVTTTFEHFRSYFKRDYFSVL